MFPKVYAVKKPKKQVNRVKKTPIALLKRQLDKIAGDKCRARGVCENPECGATNGLSWAHIVRRAQSMKIRWDMDNCFCLCMVCHMRFENHPDVWFEFLSKYHPGQHTRLMARVESLKNVMVNRSFLEAKMEELS